MASRPTLKSTSRAPNAEIKFADAGPRRDRELRLDPVVEADRIVSGRSRFVLMREFLPIRGASVAGEARHRLRDRLNQHVAKNLAPGAAEMVEAEAANLVVAVDVTRARLRNPSPCRGSTAPCRRAAPPGSCCRIEHAAFHALDHREPKRIFPQRIPTHPRDRRARPRCPSDDLAHRLRPFEVGFAEAQEEQNGRRAFECGAVEFPPKELCGSSRAPGRRVFREQGKLAVALLVRRRSIVLSPVPS